MKTYKKRTINTLKNTNNQTSIFALTIILLVSLACNFSFGKKEVEIKDELKITSKVGNLDFKEVTGYYFLSFNSKNEPRLDFHLADYKLDATDIKSLKDDLAYEENQVKVEFGFKVDKFDKVEDLFGEYSSTAEKKVYVFPKIYTDKGSVTFDTYTANGVVKINEIKDGVAKGTIKYTDKNNNSVEGTFTVFAIGKELKKFDKKKEDK